jgi:uncharacterized short protein YbdD (DUF466 family)
LEKQPDQSTTTTFLNFQRECKQLGFPITESRARSLLKTGLNPEWLIGPGSFPAYIAACVDNAYSDKAPDDRLKLFLSALAWEDKREEYTDWLEKQKAEAEENRQKAETEAERQRKEAKCRATPLPTVCGNCGAAMPPDGELCPACDHYAVWDDSQEKYIFQERCDFSALAEAFREKMRKKHRIANDNVADEDIDKYFREAR